MIPLHIPSRHVLIVEDANFPCIHITRPLQRIGCYVHHTRTQKEALQSLETHDFSVIVLNIIFNSDKSSFLSTIHQKAPTTSIILITDETSSFELNELGVKRCLNTSSDMRLFAEHILEVLREKIASDLANTLTSYMQNIPWNIFSNNPSSCLDLGYHTFFPDEALLLRKEEEITLTKEEGKLLAFFIQHQGTLLSHYDIAQGVIGYDKPYNGYKDLVRTKVSHLRKKLETKDISHKYIVTLRGKGYKFSLPIDQLA